MGGTKNRFMGDLAMTESMLLKKSDYLKESITIQTVIAAGLVALAVLLPLAVHSFLGAEGGMRWLPMYLPVLLGGCILGWKWGIGIGALSPLVSFAITALFGNAMPALSRIPYMLVELCVFALVAGAFSKKIVKNIWFALPAVVLAQVCGRGAFLVSSAIFQGVSSLSFVQAWTQVQTGISGILLQVVFVPAFLVVVRKVFSGEGEVRNL